MNLKRIGPEHPAIKELLAARRGTGRMRRLVPAEGAWAVEVALAIGAQIEALYYCPELARSPAVELAAARAAIRARHSFGVSMRVLRRIAERERPDGVVALLEMPEWHLDDVQLSSGSLILVTEGMESPGNLGTLLRTADAAGVDLVGLTNRRTSVADARVFRGSRGMSLKVPSVELGTPMEAIRWLAENRFSVYLADVRGELDYRQANYCGRTAIVVGNERFGLSPVWYNQDFDTVRIPMVGMADSLNVAVSASILLYEASAQMSAR